MQMVLLGRAREKQMAVYPGWTVSAEASPTAVAALCVRARPLGKAPFIRQPFECFRQHPMQAVLPRDQPLRTRVPNQIWETRVLGEVEKDSFITLPGKGRHTGLLP